MRISRPKFLELTRRLALLSIPLAGCSSSVTSPGAQPTPPRPSSNPTHVADQPDPTVGTGPCRCSWDTHASAAPRVCKKGEMNYEKQPCIPGGGTPSDEGYYIPGGPLPPPDLSSC